MKRYILTIGVMVMAVWGMGQVSITVPNIVPSSPDAQTFIKYGEIPVDYSTGVPNINVPIFDIECGSLKLPISISYNSSGIRVNEISGVVGLGWKFNAGGVCTRSVNGRADESSQGILIQGYLTQSEIDNATLSQLNYGKLSDASSGYTDTESDNYYYSASDGLQGQFVYDDSGNLTPIVYTDDKIEHPYARGKDASNIVKVTRNNGDTYIFGQQEYSLFDAEYYPSSWWLSKIISANRADTIYFDYEKYSKSYLDQSESFYVIFNNNGYNGTNGLEHSVTSVETEHILLKKIRFKNGYLLFDYSNDRTDLRETRLVSISIFQKGNTLPLKKYQLNHTYFYSGYANNKYNYRLKFDGINMYSQSTELISKYLFEYNQNKVLPPYINYNSTISTQSECCAIDHWGYYNGKIQNPHLIPNLPSPWVSADRSPDSDCAKACILTKITYPTGGNTSFEYEANTKFDGSLTGGLRVKRIISKADYNSTPIIKRYEYLNNMLDKDIVMDAEGRYTYSQETMYCLSGSLAVATFNSIYYMSTPLVPLLNHNGSNAIYQIVDEYTDGAELNLKTTYTYDSQPNNVYSVNSPRYYNEYYIERPWCKGQLLGTTVHKYKNGIYSPVKSISNYYSDYRIKTIVCGTKIQKSTLNRQNCTSYNGGVIFLDYYPGGPFSSLFFYFDTKIETGIKKLTTQIIAEIDESGNSVTQNKNFIYDSQFHLNQTSNTRANSDGKVFSTRYRYPTDITTGVYPSIASLNMLNYPIEETTLVNGNVTSSKLTTYKANSSSYVPDKVYSFEISTPLASTSFTAFNGATKDSRYGSNPELSFDDYNTNGTVRQLTGRDGITTAYLWDSTGSYPMAQVKGATYEQVKTYNGQAATTDSQTLYNYIKSLAPSAFTTTFTYKPLIGLSSQTDPAGRTTYYEYDTFGRLKLVKDLNQNIVKKMEYHYAGQN